LYIVANQYIEKNSEITINHQTTVPCKRCHCGDLTTCTASISPIPPPVITPPISVVTKSSSSSPLIDPTVSHSSSDDENKSQRNKRTRQRNLKKSNKKLIKKILPKAETPPPPTLPLIKNKESSGPGRPKSPIKKIETSPEPNNISNNDKMTKRVNEMVML